MGDRSDSAVGGPAKIGDAVAWTTTAVAGAVWVLATVLPWASRGPVSSSSLVHVAGRVADGSLDAFVPRPLLVLFLAPAGCGLLLLALAFLALAGWRAARLRRLVGVLGIVTSIAILVGVAGVPPTRLGPGSWLAIAGIVCCVVGECFAGCARLRRSGDGLRDAHNVG